MNPPDTSQMRHRTPTIVQRVAMQNGTYSGYSQNLSDEFGEVSIYRKTKSMYDINTPNFKERSAAGEIINNPMLLREELYEYPLINATYSGEMQQASVNLHFNVPQTQLSVSDDLFTNSHDNAITDAYANMSANEGETLLWIGELKETIAMVFDISKGARVLLDKTKDQRKKWLKGELTVEGQQKLTLQILYGVLPLEQQIADFLEGLFKIKDPNTRSTARGYRVKSDSRTYTSHHDGVTAKYMYAAYTAITAESIESVARAGVLYEIETDDTPWLAVILEPKAVVSTAYALARLSFVLDWIINVGGTLAAWSPSMGVKELSAWLTVETKHIQLTKYVPNINANPERLAPDGTTCSIETRLKWRVPVSRGDLAIVPRLDLNLDLEKLAAMVLLFAKVRKTI